MTGMIRYDLDMTDRTKKAKGRLELNGIIRDN